MTTTTAIEQEDGTDMPYLIPLGEGQSLAITIPAKWLRRTLSGEPLLLPPAVRYLDRVEAIFTRQADWTPGRIIAFRDALGLTQEQFGQKLGVAKMTVSRWECGRMKPSRHAIEKMKRMQRQSQRKGIVVNGEK